MKIRPIPGMVVAACAVAIALAPVARAADTTVHPVAQQQIQPAPMTCNWTRAGSMCTSPGNAELNDAPPFVNNYPMYGFFPWIL